MSNGAYPSACLNLVILKCAMKCENPGGGGGRTPIWKGRGCSSEILNLTPKRDQSGRGGS